MDIPRNAKCKTISSCLAHYDGSVGPNSSPLEHVAGSGELLDNILRHGGHDIFWCYSFEREVSNVVNIPSNQVNSEVTYSNYFSRYWFTKIYKCIQVDGDGLFPGCRALVQVHKYLQPSTNAQRSELLCSSLICEQWHASCIIVTPSQDVARALWKLIPTMRPCFCKELMERKGILIGQKKGLDSKVLETERLYLQTYWSLHAGFIEDLLPFFSASIQVFPSLLLHGQVYRVNDLVVIKPDGASSSHSWTWKAKVRKFFVHGFQGLKQVFFQGEYYVTIPSSTSVAMALEHELTGMQVVQKDHLQEWCDFNVRLVEQIMFKFIPLPVCGQNVPVFVAYELEDIAPRDHLLAIGKPGCVPPYPKVGDVVLARGLEWQRDRPVFSTAVVRSVTTQKYLLDEPMEELERRKEIAASSLEEQDYFVGNVDLEWLQICDQSIGSHSQKYICSRNV